MMSGSKGRVGSVEGDAALQCLPGGLRASVSPAGWNDITPSRRVHRWPRRCFTQGVHGPQPVSGSGNGAGGHPTSAGPPSRP